MELNLARFKCTYNLSKEIDALQAAIEIYVDCENTLETAQTLLDILIERTQNSITLFSELHNQIESKLKEQ